MKVPWELLLIVAILVIAAAAVQAASGGLQQPASGGRPQREAPTSADLASDSSAPGGARALYLWLQSLGYGVERLEKRDFRPDETIDALLILAPTTTIDKDQVGVLRRWVEGGGVLILAGGDAVPRPQASPSSPVTGENGLHPVLEEFGMRLGYIPAKREVAPAQPVLLRPVVNRARVETSNYVVGRANLVPYLGDADRPVAAGLAVGKGQVYVLASAFAFSNEGLGEADNAALLLNWLPDPEEAGTIAFDEVHHDRVEAPSFTYLLLHEPWGWAAVYSLGIVFLYLLLGGRRFGRPVPSVVDTRRMAAEYVVSLASLLRKDGKGNWAAQRYEQGLRQRLVAACGLDASLDSLAVAERLGELGQLGPGVEGGAAGRVLLELRQGANNGIAESRLVQLAAEAARIIKACSGRQI